MYRRIDVGTDVAMIGVWDAARDGTAWKSHDDLERDAADAKLFLLYTGADGGGPVDIYVDADVPADAMTTLKPLGREFLVEAPSGRLIVGGVEDYRASNKRITSEDSIVTLPAGDYALRCYAGPDDDEVEPKSDAEIRKLVGAENLRWYDRMHTVGLGVGCLTPIVIYPLLLMFMRWFVALPLAFVAFLGYFHLMKWALQRNPRYRELERVIDPLRLASQPPAFVFELRKVADRSGLSGGSLRAMDA